MNHPQTAPGQVTLRLFTTAISLLVMLGASISADSQCTQKLSELPPATELAGFHLGMTRDDVKARVPQTVFGHADDFGVSKTTINPYFDTRIDKSKFEGVRSVSLDFLEDRLTSLWIGYDQTFKVQTVDEFVKVISQSLHLPATWAAWKGRGQHLRCTDFDAIVTSVAGSPSLRLLDTTAEETIAARRQAKEEQDSAAESAAAEKEEVPELVGDTHDKTYYPAGCQPAKDISEQNRITFKTAAAAEKAGFKAAKGCH